MTFAEQIEHQGKLKGIQQGKQEGTLATTQKLALNMLREGADTAFVAKVTELSISDSLD